MKSAVCFGVMVLASQAVAEGDFSFTREVSSAPEVCRRVRAGGKTRIFAERQPYLPFENFMHFWTDRPLFTDVRLRYGKMPRAEAGFYRDIAILQRSGFDGFGSINYPGLYYDQMNVFLARRPVSGYAQMPVLDGFGGVPQKGSSSYQIKKKFIETAANCPSAERIDGRPAVWCYGGRANNHLDWVRALRADSDVPPFFFFGEVPFLGIYGELARARKEGRPVAFEEVEKLRKQVKDALDTFDGFQMRFVDLVRDPDRDYEYRGIIDPVYRDYLLPVLLDLLKKPEYARKRIGAYMRHSYVNPFNGWQNGEFGTAYLRAYLDAALMIRADFLMAFEWNEANENTSFQPTMSSGTSIARIVDYYRTQLDGERPRPRPDDDMDIPNLIVSARQSLRIGERHHLELLYVPDGTQPLPFEARLVLKGADGRRLGELPWEKLPTERLTAFSYDVSSLPFAKENVLALELETRCAGKTRRWTGFDCTRLRASNEWHYLYTRQALRDVFQPEGVSFDVRHCGNGEYRISGSLVSDRQLASLEVVDGIEEIVAADVSNEFDRCRFDLFRGTCTALRSMPANGTVDTIDVKGSTNWFLRNAYSAWNTFSDARREPGKPQRVWFNVCNDRSVFLLAVPKEDTADARLVLSIPRLGDPREVSLASVRANGRFAFTYPQQVRLELERMDDLPDYPAPLDGRSASISVVLPSRNLHPVYQLRAVTKSGKQWRSAPIVPFPGVEAPDLDYDFSDARLGDWLPVKRADRRYDIRLGGGFVYAEPLCKNTENILPKDFVTSVPGRVTEDGFDALSFDGRGQCLTIPVETIPESAPFALEFELKPADADNRVYLRMHHSFSVDTGLRIVSENGELVVSYFARNHIAPWVMRTGIRLVPDRWSRVTIEKTADKVLKTSLDGLETGRMTCDYPMEIFANANFGGNVMPGPAMPGSVRPFRGFLRSLHIRHLPGVN